MSGIVVAVVTAIYFFMLRGEIPFPKSVSLGFLDIHLYGVFILSGVCIVSFLFDREKQKYPELKKVDTVDALLWILIPAIIFARLWHVATDFFLYTDNIQEIFFIWNGGLGIFGGLIGGLAGAYFYAKKNSIDLVKALSLVAVFLPLGQVIGRFGNFANRELYGNKTDLPWGLFLEEYKKSFHPTFAYEQVGNFLLFLILFSLYRKLGLSRKWISIYLLGYSVVRFCVDAFRKEPRIWMNMTVAQIICLVLVFVNIIYLIKVKKRDGKS